MSTYVTAATAQLPEQARTAMQSINGEPRRMLALRSYLRADTTLVARWSWTAQQIGEYEQSPQYRALLQAIEAVGARFQSRNPGYSLFANTQVRSLEQQLQRWNENKTVSMASRHLSDAVRAELAQGYPALPDAAAMQRFVIYLKSTVLEVPVSLAAPGLSLHGQSRAIDFQVQRGARIVAGPNVASVVKVWRRQGWAKKLAQAVKAEPGAFAGPLQMPDEPWHYQYLR